MSDLHRRQRGLNQSFGSDKNLRTYVRLDSGELGFGRFSLSAVKQNADKWKGFGEQRQDQVNLKYAADVGEHRISAWVNTSKRREIDYKRSTWVQVPHWAKDADCH